MTINRKGRRPKIEWKFERVDAGPMSEEDFDFVCDRIAQWIYDAEMKKRQTLGGDNEAPLRVP